MANFARIQNRIYYGYGKAAQRLGTTHSIYRSATGIDPIEDGNLIGEQLISVDNDYKYNKAKKYNDPVWQFLPEDGAELQNYDYFISESGVIYFIVDILPDDRLTPPVCVECNSRVSISRPTRPLTPGKQDSYIGYIPADSTPILTDCPASVLQHSRMESNNMKLPTSARLPFYSILLPNFDGVLVKTGDIIQDSEDRRMSVINAELTKKTLGLRIIASEQGA